MKKVLLTLLLLLYSSATYAVQQGTGMELKDGSVTLTTPVIISSGGTGTASNPIRSVYFDAAGMIPDGTNCALPASLQLNSGPTVRHVSCTSNSAGTIEAKVNMPDSWAGGTLTFELQTTYSTVPSGSLTFDMDFSCMCRGSGDLIDNNWGSPQNAVLTISTQWNEVHATTSAVTCNGGCAAGDTVYWRGVVDNVASDADNTSILGVKMEFTANAYTD